MTEIVTKSSRWKPGQSGNPRGRPLKSRALTEILLEQGNAPVMTPEQEISAKEAVARALWQFAVTGEVWLAGKRLEAKSVTEWANVVKWLYGHAETNEVVESVVRVVRADRPPLQVREPSAAALEAALYPPDKEEI
jgi:hypothetical protein